MSSIPSQIPAHYRTLKGLLAATERVLIFHRNSTAGKVAGQSSAMWLTNAEFSARSTFNDTTSVQALRQKYAITRPQDLVGGNALFGIPLPTRAYGIGDNVPGVGLITDQVDTGNGMQFEIGGQWFHERALQD